MSALKTEEQIRGMPEGSNTKWCWISTAFIKLKWGRKKSAIVAEIKSMFSSNGDATAYHLLIARRFEHLHNHYCHLRVVIF